MKPFGNNILVKPDEMPTEHKGLFIPDSARKPNFKGTIVAVGQGLYNSPMKLKVGDYIMYDSATPRSEEHTSELQSHSFIRMPSSA